MNKKDIILKLYLRELKKFCSYKNRISKKILKANNNPSLIFIKKLYETNSILKDVLEILKGN